jgi:hypothetical protein
MADAHRQYAVAAGLVWDDCVHVTQPGCKELQGMTLSELQRWCSERAAMATECLFRFRIQQALLQVIVWVNDLDDSEALIEDQAILAAETGCYLLQVLQDAQTASVPDQIQVNLYGQPITLAEAKALGEYVATARHRHEK